jgi:uncharacterized membrane protein
LKTKNATYITLTAVFAAVYAVGVIVLAPISFLPVQVRVADALLPLSMIFGWPAVLGLSIGAFVANFYGLGPVDMVGGAAANFIGTYLAWKVSRHRGKFAVFAGVAIEILTVTLIVGSYLSYLLAQPIQLMWLDILAGSVIAIGILGSIVFFALSTERIRQMLRSYRIIS